MCVCGVCDVCGVCVWCVCVVCVCVMCVLCGCCVSVVLCVLCVWCVVCVLWVLCECYVCGVCVVCACIFCDTHLSTSFSHTQATKGAETSSVGFMSKLFRKITTRHGPSSTKSLSVIPGSPKLPSSKSMPAIAGESYGWGL